MTFYVERDTFVDYTLIPMVSLSEEIKNLFLSVVPGEATGYKEIGFAVGIDEEHLEITGYADLTYIDFTRFSITPELYSNFIFSVKRSGAKDNENHAFCVQIK